MKNKGCVNPECDACRRREHFKEENKYCSECGSKLEYVCLDCHTVLPDNTKRYCLRCEAKNNAKGANIKNNLEKAGEVVMAAAPAIAAGGKFIADHKDTIIPAAKKVGAVAIKIVAKIK